MTNTKIVYTIQEFDEESFPWWEDSQDWDDYQECVRCLKRLREAWPAIKWRIVKKTQEVLDA